MLFRSHPFVMWFLDFELLMTLSTVVTMLCPLYLQVNERNDRSPLKGEETDYREVLVLQRLKVKIIQQLIKQSIQNRFPHSNELPLKRGSSLLTPSSSLSPSEVIHALTHRFPEQLQRDLSSLPQHYLHVVTEIVQLLLEVAV